MQSYQEKKQLLAEVRSTYAIFKSLKQQEALKTNPYLQGAGEAINDILKLLDINSFEEFETYIVKKNQKQKVKEQNKQKQICPLCEGEGYTVHKTYGSKQKCIICKGTKEVTAKRLKDLDLL